MNGWWMDILHMQSQSNNHTQLQPVVKFSQVKNHPEESQARSTQFAVPHRLHLLEGDVLFSLSLFLQNVFISTTQFNLWGDIFVDSKQTSPLLLQCPWSICCFEKNCPEQYHQKAGDQWKKKHFIFGLETSPSSSLPPDCSWSNQYLLKNFYRVESMKNSPLYLCLKTVLWVNCFVRAAVLRICDVNQMCSDACCIWRQCTACMSLLMCYIM